MLSGQGSQSALAALCIIKPSEVWKLPPKSWPQPLPGSPPPIPSCLSLLQPSGILLQPLLEQPIPLPASSSGAWSQLQWEGQEGGLQQDLASRGSSVLTLSSPRCPSHPPHFCPSIFQMSSPKLSLPQRCPGASQDPMPQSMG